MIIFDLNTQAYPDVSEDQLVEACGLLPMFFIEAAEGLESANEPVATLAKDMDSLYGFGGFSIPMEGTIDSKNNTYVSKYEEDEPLSPYVTIYSRGYICHIYPYAIVAVGGNDEPFMIARMD